MMGPLIVAIALFLGFLVGSRVGSHRWRREVQRIDGLLTTQGIPYLTKRATELGIKPALPTLDAGGAVFQVVALCAMIEAKERKEGAAKPEADPAS